MTRNYIFDISSKTFDQNRKMVIVDFFLSRHAKVGSRNKSRIQSLGKRKKLFTDPNIVCHECNYSWP